MALWVGVGDDSAHDLSGSLHCRVERHSQARCESGGGVRARLEKERRSNEDDFEASVSRIVELDAAFEGFVFLEVPPAAGEFFVGGYRPIQLHPSAFEPRMPMLVPCELSAFVHGHQVNVCAETSCAGGYEHRVAPGRSRFLVGEVNTSQADPLVSLLGLEEV